MWQLKSRTEKRFERRRIETGKKPVTSYALWSCFPSLIDSIRRFHFIQYIHDPCSGESPAFPATVLWQSPRCHLVPPILSKKGSHHQRVGYLKKTKIHIFSCFHIPLAIHVPLTGS